MAEETASLSPALAGLFSLRGRVAVVTGGTGTLGSEMVRGLASAGAKVAILGRRLEVGQALAEEVEAAGGTAMAVAADVCDRSQLEAARDAILEAWGELHILVNGAGGNVKEATIAPDDSFFDMPDKAMDDVVKLNLQGTVLPSQVFGAHMAAAGAGNIINISSMAAQTIITRVAGYSAAKAAVENFTRWLAVELAHKHGERLRVNAIAPGFFIAEQNRSLLLKEDGSYTSRGEKIIEGTPMGRFGTPDELVGTLIWLASDASKFVTGTVVAVDGGFQVFSGV
eukprot:PLAT4055.1.p1 GENE.PLAT4055.1~~PLAT4055.1.p1  ORF type:complete len:302 (+),score=102.92 PLAT4055.1:60-908(+)